MAGKKQHSSFDELRHKLETEMLNASSLKTQIEQQGFINRQFMSLHKARQEKRITQPEFVKLINRLAAYQQGRFNDYIDLLAGAAQMGTLEMVIQGEISQFTPEAARQRRDAVTDLAGMQPAEPEPSNPMMRRYENAIRSNMASAERDYKNSPEDRRGFIIGAVLQLWETYHRDKRIDESQFDKLISILAGFSGGEYRDFINEQVAAYKRGEPPTIIGY
jgi:hypothetical protein